MNLHFERAVQRLEPVHLLLNQRALSIQIPAVECVKFGGEQGKKLFNRQRMKIPCQIQLTEHIGKATGASGAFGTESRTIASIGSIIVESCGDPDDGVAGDE